MIFCFYKRPCTWIKWIISIGVIEKGYSRSKHDKMEQIINYALHLYLIYLFTSQFRQRHLLRREETEATRNFPERPR